MAVCSINPVDQDIKCRNIVFRKRCSICHGLGESTVKHLLEIGYACAEKCLVNTE